MTASYILPRCTGKCGALATNSPFGLKIAQEKSSLSLILVETEVYCNVFPIYSAIDINREPNIDNSIGSQIYSLSSSIWIN